MDSQPEAYLRKDEVYARDGYKRKPGIYRRLTRDEVFLLRVGEEVWTYDKNQNMRTIRITGKTHKWVRQPLRFKKPWKYGLYEYGYLESDANGELNMDVFFFVCKLEDRK